MIADLISENEFRQRLALWKLENDIGVYLPSSLTKAEYLEIFRLPDFELVHYNSYPDKNDDLITLLKGEIHLKGWETKNGKEPKSFSFYKVLKTLTDAPVLEPQTIGYIIL